MMGMNIYDTRSPSECGHSKLSTDTKFWLFLAPFFFASLAGWSYLLWWFSGQAPVFLTRVIKLLYFFV